MLDDSLGHSDTLTIGFNVTVHDLPCVVSRYSLFALFLIGENITLKTRATRTPIKHAQLFFIPISQLLSVDVVDVTGTDRRNVTKNINMLRVDHKYDVCDRHCFYFIVTLEFSFS